MTSFKAVRIELRVSCGAMCAFTIDAQFVIDPNIGDFLVFESVQLLTTKIAYICHYFSKPGCIIITDPIICEAYDDLLCNLDWFKSNYRLDDIKSDDNPQPYYVFYRSVLQLLDRSKDVNPCLALDPTSIKIFVEVCRSVLVAEFGRNDDIIQYAKDFSKSFNQAVADLYMMIINRKKDEPNGIQILPLIKEWERRFNISGNIKWEATFAQCRQAARVVFEKLRSIPEEKLPDFGE